jgi:hypothetical protein
LARHTPILPTLALLLAGTAIPAAAPPDSRPDGRDLARCIDRHLDAALDRAKVAVAGPADDATFLRRVYLDLAGRIPSVAEARAFLADRRPDRRRRLVDELLARPAFTSHLAQVLRSALVPQATANLQTQHLGLSLEAWLALRLRKDTRYDRLVRDLLTVPLDYLDRRARPLSSVSAVAFYQAGDLKPETVTASVARLFLGVRLECAQCHDHPFDKWTRRQFWQTAAFFAAVAPAPGNSKPARSLALRRELEDPLGKTLYQARYLDGRLPNWSKQPGPRRVFADWLAAADNPYFAPVAVNRMWAHFFGVGLVDPVDDFNPSNEPSHPLLLAELARRFARHGFDLRALARGIVLSRAYQRGSEGRDTEPRLYARMNVKGLSAEQLFDSLALATGYRESVPRAARPAFGYEKDSPRGQFLATFGGGAARSDQQMAILQALALMNGDWIARQTDPKRGETLLAVLGAPFLDDEGRLEALFLATLSRLPRAAEKRRFLALVERGRDEGKKAEALADVLWVLLNSHEFLLNH